MNRRGSALLLVLWLLVLLTGLVALSMGGARVGAAAGHNRITLLKAGWAAEACLEVLMGRSQNHSSGWRLESLSLDSIDLGDGIWCSADVSDPGERLNLNVASREAMLRLVRDTSLVDTLLALRPWPSVESLVGLSGFSQPTLSHLMDQLTVRGTGKINLNRAPPEILQTLPGIDAAGARALVSARAIRPAFGSLEDAVQALPSDTRGRVLIQYQAFAAMASLEPEQLVVELGGRVRDAPLIGHTVVTLVPAGSRFAVIRRETE